MSQAITEMVRKACAGALDKFFEAHFRDVEELRGYCDGGPLPEGRTSVPLWAFVRHMEASGKWGAKG